jgi:hypothetical protein
MSTIKLTIKKPLKNIELLKAEDYINQNLEKTDVVVTDYTFDLDEILQEAENNIKQSEMMKKRPVFYEEYSISEQNQPITISLKKLPDDTLPLEEVKKEVQTAYNNGFNDGEQVTRSTLELEIQKLQFWVKNIDGVTENLKNQFMSEMRKL